MLIFNLFFLKTRDLRLSVFWIFRLVEEEGVTTILCLQEDINLDYFSVDISAIRKRCQARGDVRHVRCPVRDFDPSDLRKQLPKVSGLHLSLLLHACVFRSLPWSLNNTIMKKAIRSTFTALQVQQHWHNCDRAIKVSCIETTVPWLIYAWDIWVSKDLRMFACTQHIELSCDLGIFKQTKKIQLGRSQETLVNQWWLSNGGSYRADGCKVP